MNDACLNLVERFNELLDRVDRLLPPQGQPPAWGNDVFLFQRGRLRSVIHPHEVHLEQLLGMDRQKGEIVRNTHQFVLGQPANNVLLWGARGTGKSSLVKAVFNAFRGQKLCLIEAQREEVHALPDLFDLIWGRPERFLLFLDDLSFEAGDPSYKALKAALDGSVMAIPDNLLIYATSNRRHLMPEYLPENQESSRVEGEIHPGEASEEKISLSDRFGLWLSFHPCSQEQYLQMAMYWLMELGCHAVDPVEMDRAALLWALTRGARNGRVARQFAQDWVGRDACRPPLPADGSGSPSSAMDTPV